MKQGSEFRRTANTPKEPDGLYLVGRYFILAKLQPELSEAQNAIKNSSHDDRRQGLFEEILKRVQQKVNAASSSTLGNKITWEDVRKYVDKSLNEDR